MRARVYVAAAFKMMRRKSNLGFQKIVNFASSFFLSSSSSILKPLLARALPL
jgi:hypothetical protein